MELIMYYQLNRNRTVQIYNWATVLVNKLVPYAELLSIEFDLDFAITKVWSDNYVVAAW